MMSKLQGTLKFTSICSLQLGQKMHVKSLKTNQFEALVLKNRFYEEITAFTCEDLLQ